MKEDLKNNRQNKLKKHQIKLVLVKKVVANWNKQNDWRSEAKRRNLNETMWFNA